MQPIDGPAELASYITMKACYHEPKWIKGDRFYKDGQLYEYKGVVADVDSPTLTYHFLEQLGSPNTRHLVETTLLLSDRGFTRVDALSRDELLELDRALLRWYENTKEIDPQAKAVAIYLRRESYITTRDVSKIVAPQNIEMFKIYNRVRYISPLVEKIWYKLAAIDAEWASLVGNWDKISGLISSCQAASQKQAQELINKCLSKDPYNHD